MNRRQFLLAALASALAAPLRAATNLDDLKANGSLRVAVYRDFPPFSWTEHGELRGIDVDLARAIGQALGLKVNFMPLTAADDIDGDLRNAIWKGHYLGGGTADLMLHVPFDPELAQRIHNAVLFGPYYTEQMAWAGQRPPGAVTLIDHGTRIGVENDSLADLYLAALQGGRLRPSLQHYPNTPSAARALLASEVDAVFGPQSELDWALAASAKPVAPLATPGLVKTSWEIGMATKETLRDLGWAVTDALENIRQSGLLAKLFAAYQVRYTPAAAH